MNITAEGPFRGSWGTLVYTAGGGRRFNPAGLVVLAVGAVLWAVRRVAGWASRPG